MNSKSSKLFKIEFFTHGFNYIIANFFSKGLVFLMLPIFARMLTPSEYGIYSIYVTVVSIFSVLISLNIPAAIKQCYLIRKKDFSELLGTNLIFGTIAIVPTCIVYYLLKDKISHFFGIPTKVFGLSIIVCIFLMFYNMYTGYLEARQKSYEFLKLSCFNKIIECGLCIVFLYHASNNKYYAPMYGQIIAISIFSSICLYKIICIAKFKFRLEYLKYSLIYAIPLIPHNLSSFILAQFDRIVLNQISGSSATGIYSFAYNIGMSVTVIVNSLNSSWVPIFFKNYGEKNYDFLENLAKKFFKVIYLFSILIILFSREITMIVSTQNYYGGICIIPIIILGNIMIFFYVLYANYAFYYNKTWIISINTFIAGITNIILNYIFIPKYGYIAAAYTTLFSYIVLFLLHYLNSKYILKAKVMSLNIFKIDFIKLSIIVSVYFIFINKISSVFFAIAIKVAITMLLVFLELRNYKVTEKQ